MKRNSSHHKKTNKPTGNAFNKRNALKNRKVPEFNKYQELRELSN